MTALDNTSVIHIAITHSSILTAYCLPPTSYCGSAASIVYRLNRPDRDNPEADGGRCGERSHDMAFFGTQAKKDRRRVKRQINREEKRQNPRNPERNNFWQHMPGTQNREKRHELHDNRQHERPADLLRNNSMATIHRVHA